MLLRTDSGVTKIAATTVVCRVHTRAEVTHAERTASETSDQFAARDRSGDCKHFHFACHFVLRFLLKPNVNAVRRFNLDHASHPNSLRHVEQTALI